MDGPLTRAVPVDGGTLAVAEWGTGSVVLAVHGITASSRAWIALARLLPDVRLLAPDLRGRARSNGLPGPFGLRRHADDLRRVLDELAIERTVAVGHSMGAFVAVLLAAAEPDRIGALVLVDGGVPLAPPTGVDIEALDPAALLGPAYDRLTRTFDDPAAYEAFWRGHPAFARGWTEDVADYARYDLDRIPGGYRPSAVPAAVAADQRELFGPAWYRAELEAVRQPVTILRAPLGLQAEPPGLYAPGVLDAFAADDALRRLVEVPDVNHYTILMRDPRAVADAVRDALP